MNKLLVTLCAAALSSGPALAQSPANNSNTRTQTPAATTTSPNVGPGSGQTTGNTGASAAKPTGIQSMTTSAVTLSFYSVQPADMRVSKLMGAEVYNLNNENVGEIEDLIIDNGKNIRGVIVSVGGFLGMGESHVAVQPNSLTTTEQNDGGFRVVINTNKDELKNAPKVKLEDVDKRASMGATGSTSNASATTDTNRPSK